MHLLQKPQQMHFSSLTIALLFDVPANIVHDKYMIIT